MSKTMNTKADHGIIYSVEKWNIHGYLMSGSDPVMVAGGLSPGHHLWKPQAEFDQYTCASLRKGPPVISSAGSAVIGTSV
ncbi:hypothetical protein Peur_013906 [Populus x canadensis]